MDSDIAVLLRFQQSTDCDRISASLGEAFYQMKNDPIFQAEIIGLVSEDFQKDAWKGVRETLLLIERSRMHEKARKWAKIDAVPLIYIKDAENQLFPLALNSEAYGGYTDDYGQGHAEVITSLMWYGTPEIMIFSESFINVPESLLKFMVPETTLPLSPGEQIELSHNFIEKFRDLSSDELKQPTVREIQDFLRNWRPANGWELFKILRKEINSNGLAANFFIKWIPFLQCGDNEHQCTPSEFAIKYATGGDIGAFYINHLDSPNMKNYAQELIIPNGKIKYKKFSVVPYVKKSKSD